MLRWLVLGVSLTVLLIACASRSPSEDQNRISVVDTTTTFQQNQDRLFSLGLAEETENIALWPGCNLVAWTGADNSSPQTLSGLLTSPEALTSIWKFEPETIRWLGFSPNAPATVNDLVSINQLDAVFLCVREFTYWSRPLLPPSKTPAATLVPTSTPTPNPTATFTPTATSTPAAKPIAAQGKIAYQDGEGNAWIINPDGSGKVYITNKACRYWWCKTSSLPSWSPTGNKLAINTYSDNDEHQWWAFNSSGNSLMKIGEAGTYTGGTADSPDGMSWSPDGSSVVYGRYDDGLYETSLNTGNTNAILTTTGFTYDHSPVWSPDGTKLVFVHHEFGSEFHVSIINFDEGKIPYKGEEWDYQIFNPDFTLLTSGYSEFDEPFRFQWTPDGRKIIFSAVDQTDSAVGTIYVIDVGSGSVRKIQPPGLGPDDVPDNVDLSNDGQKIAFFTNGNLYVVDIDGSNLRQLYSSDYPSLSEASFPRWAPDDSVIAFTSFVSGEGQSIRVINADGSSLQAIPGTADARAIAWTRAPR